MSLPMRAVMTSDSPWFAQQRAWPDDTMSPLDLSTACSPVTPFGTVDKGSTTLSTRTLTSSTSTGFKLRATIALILPPQVQDTLLFGENPSLARLIPHERISSDAI